MMDQTTPELSKSEQIAADLLERRREHLSPKATKLLKRLIEALESVEQPEGYSDLTDEARAWAKKHGTYSTEDVFARFDTEEGYLDGSWCRCGVEDKYGACLTHTVQDHPYNDLGEQPCCEQPKDAHRQPTYAERRAMYPRILRAEWRDAKGSKFVLDAHRYKDGVGACITNVYPELTFEEAQRQLNEDGKMSDDEVRDYMDSGVCFDFPGDHQFLQGFIKALVELRDQQT